ncbi:MAG: molybdopterin converting factor subunit 1 [Lautropia sp.]
MQVTVLYFASLREALSRSRETLQLPPSVSTAGELRAWLASRDEDFARALGPSRAVRVAVDQDMADGATPLRDGAEVAFFPPVTGG